MMTNFLTATKPLTGRAVLLVIIGFFAVVFAVNGVFLSLAISTNSGIVADEPYRKGLKYNERIAADELQIALGWKSDISINTRGDTLVVALRDRDGNALGGLVATAKVGRAATDREDLTVVLTETARGRYEALLPLHQIGGYIANLEVSDPNAKSQGVIYRDRRRLWLKPH